MKKILAVLLTLALLQPLAACSDATSNEDVGNTASSGALSSSKAGGEEATTAGAAKDTRSGVQVDKGLFTVDVTLPASFFSDMTEEEIKAGAEENGYSSYSVNDDGSVTYTTTKSQHADMLKEMKSGLDETIQDLIEGDEAVASFLSIDYTDDISEVKVYVDPETYSEFDSFSALTFYMTGAMYQSFEGVQPEEIDVVVYFIDNETKEVIDTASYKEFAKDTE